MQHSCLLCRKTTDKLINGYCEECYKKEFKLIEIPHKIEIIQCKNCGKINSRNKWYHTSIENEFLKTVRIKGKDVKIKLEKSKTGFRVFAKGYVNGDYREERNHVEISINNRICPICAKKKSGYYEATLQLRGNYNDQILNFIETQLNKIEGRDNKAFFRTKKVRGGVDYLIGSKSATNKVAELLKRQFNAELKRSYKLHTRKEGMNIYRDVILVRF